MWFPDVKTSTGSFVRSAKSSAVTPKPPAAFSMLTTVKSILSRPMIFSSRESAFRPGFPTTSPTNRSFKAYLSARVPRGGSGGIEKPPGSFRKVNGPGFSDDRYLDLPRVLELRLDPLRDVLRHPEALVVVHLLRVDDDAQLSPGLDGVGLLDPLHAVRHLLELLDAP